MSSHSTSFSRQKELREMMAAAKSNRVTDRLAKYDTQVQGRLTCVICKVQMQEAEWKEHTISNTHKQTLDSLRDLARKKAAASGVAAPAASNPSTPASSPSSSSSLSSGSITTTTIVVKKLPQPTSSKPTTASSSSSSAAPPPPTVTPALTKVPSGLPSDFSAASPVTPATVQTPTVIQPTNVIGLGLGAYGDDDDEDEEDHTGGVPAAASGSITNVSSATHSTDPVQSSTSMSHLPSDFFDSSPPPPPPSQPSQPQPTTTSNDASDTNSNKNVSASSSSSSSSVPTSSSVRSTTIVGGATLKTGSAFVIGAAPSINPILAASLPAAKSFTNTTKTTKTSSTLPSSGTSQSTSSTAATSVAVPRRDLTAEHVAFDALMKTTLSENVEQSELDRIELLKLRRKNDRFEEESYGQRLKTLKHVKEETKKRLAQAKEERAKKRAKLSNTESEVATPVVTSSNNNNSNTGTVDVVEDDNPFLDWRQ